MKKERIDKILSSQNVASRSEIKAMIRSGRIFADEKRVQSPDEKYDPEATRFTVDGKTVEFSRFVYIMMNKPAGVLSASTDRHAKTVIDLLPPEMQRRDLFPAGRLDKDTVGFILITNDGELAHKMLSPKSHVYKLYEVQCDRPLTDDDVNAFAKGINIGELECQPAQMRITGTNSALVEICEGKFHQIKRMFHAVGAEVTALKRVRIGEVVLDETLRQGEARYLNNEEIIDILSRKHGI